MKGVSFPPQKKRQGTENFSVPCLMLGQVLASTRFLHGFLKTIGQGECSEMGLVAGPEVAAQIDQPVAPLVGGGVRGIA